MIAGARLARDAAARGATAASDGYAFGLRIDAAFPLPGLRGAAFAGGRDRRVRLQLAPDAEIDAAWPRDGAEEVRRILTPGGRVAVLTSHHPEAGYLITAPEYGRHLVSPDGTLVRCAPAAIPPERWQGVLVGQALPIVATLQGLEVFHASAVVIGGQAVAFTGPSGIGKSTLATGLLLAGARFFSDDVLALEARGQRMIAHAGIGVARLWPELQPTVVALAAHGLGATFGSDIKTLVEIQRDVASLPLASLYVLQRAQSPDDVGIESIEPDVRLLLGSTHNISVTAPERLRRQLDLVATLAARARTYAARGAVGGQDELTRLVFEHAAREALG